jgi:hypothetical protein
MSTVRRPLRYGSCRSIAEWKALAARFNTSAGVLGGGGRLLFEDQWD